MVYSTSEPVQVRPNIGEVRGTKVSHGVTLVWGISLSTFSRPDCRGSFSRFSSSKRSRQNSPHTSSENSDLSESYGSNSNIIVGGMYSWIGADGTAPPDNIPIAISQTSTIKCFSSSSLKSIPLMLVETICSQKKPRHPGPRGNGELGEDHHSQQFYLAG